MLRDERAVLLVDTFERIQGLEGWLRERFLPRLRVGALLAFAVGHPPALLLSAAVAVKDGGASRRWTRNQDGGDPAGPTDGRGALGCPPARP
ncbi:MULTISPECIES: hypothetical protein [Nonomuraea]|uniref:Uncharacterized protein n=1 Tax=Nonomuraea mangrovi TaxID=2316207 RepID=A0ABW4TDE2_9ACTN